MFDAQKRISFSNDWCSQKESKSASETKLREEIKQLLKEASSLSQ